MRLRQLLIGATLLSAWSCAGDVDEGTGPSGQAGSGMAGGGAGGSSGGGTTGSAGAGGTAGNVTTGTAGAAGVAGTAGSAGPAGSAGAAGGGAGRGGAGGSAGGSAGASGPAGRGGQGGTAGNGGRGGAAGSSAGAGGTAAATGRGGQGGAAGTAGSGTGGAGNAPPLPTPTWSANIRLNDDTGNGRQAEVALATGPSGLAIAGWMDERSTRVCAFSVTTDGGKSWSSKNVSIPNVSGMFVGDPAVAIDGGGTIYAICQEYLNLDAGTGNIRMMTSTDKGVSWSTVRTIGSAPDKPWGGGGITEGTVFVSWLGNPGGIKRSTDRGMTWGPTQSLGNIIHGTAINVSTTGLVHVPYNLDSNRNQLRYLRSKNNGDTWEATRDLIPDMGTFCFSCNPRQHPIVGQGADPTGKYVAITWSSRMTGGQGDDDVWLLYSSNGGDTWTQPIRVNDNTNTSRQFEPWVAVDNFGRVHVAWTDFRNGMNETWYARSADPTKGFEPNQQITDGRGSGNTDFLGDYKGIAVSGTDVLVVWEDTRRDQGDIFFSRAAGAAGP